MSCLFFPIQGDKWTSSSSCFGVTVLQALIIFAKKETEMQSGPSSCYLLNSLILKPEPRLKHLPLFYVLTPILELGRGLFEFLQRWLRPQTQKGHCVSRSLRGDLSLLNFPQGERLLFALRMLMIYLWELEVTSTTSNCLCIIFTLNLLGFFLLDPFSLLSFILSQN